MALPPNKTQMLAQEVENLKAIITAMRAEIAMIRTALEDMHNDGCFMFDWQEIFNKIPLTEVRDATSSDELVKVINTSIHQKPLDIKAARSMRQFFMSNFKVDIWDYRLK